MSQATADNRLVSQLLPKIKEIINETDGALWQYRYQSMNDSSNGAVSVFSAKVDSTTLCLKCLSYGISHSSWGGKSFSLEVTSESGPALGISDQPDGSEVSELFRKAQEGYEKALKAKHRSLEEQCEDAKIKIQEYLEKELNLIIRLKRAEWRSAKDGHRTTINASLEGYNFSVIQERRVYFGQEFPSVRVAVETKVGNEAVRGEVEGEKAETILEHLKEAYPRCFVFQNQGAPSSKRLK